MVKYEMGFGCEISHLERPFVWVKLNACAEELSIKSFLLQIAE